MKSRIIVFSLLTCLFFSCQKEFVSPPIESLDVYAISPEKLKNRIDVLKEVSSVLMEVYKDPVALYEVNAAIYSEYYADETVLLRDLLYPETSPIYKSNKFLERKPKTGVFRAKFAETFLKGSYPTLRTALGNAVKDLEAVNNSLLQQNASRARTNLGSSSSFDSQALFGPFPSQPDTAREIFSNSEGVSIYFPYSENFGSVFTPEWFDAINTDPFGVLATIVTADREADSGPGQSARKTYVDNEPTIRYVNVTVDDVYAETKMTHIVGIGAEPDMPMNPPPPVPTPGVNIVYIGEMKCNYNHDKFISSQGRGGGNDIKIMRISGYLQPVNSQVTTFSGDYSSIQFKRKDVTKKRYKRIYAVWDADWQPANTEQVLFVFEDDDNVTKRIQGSLTTTLTAPGGVGTVNTSISYDMTLNNVDVIYKQLKISRSGYFGQAYQDKGFGFSSDRTFLLASDPHGWPYWEGSNSGYMSWTWPYQVIQ